MLEEGECINLYDETALFTSVPFEPAIRIIKNKLEWDMKVQKQNYHVSQ